MLNVLCARARTFLVVAGCLFIRCRLRRFLLCMYVCIYLCARDGLISHATRDFQIADCERCVFIDEISRTSGLCSTLGRSQTEFRVFVCVCYLWLIFLVQCDRADWPIVSHY